MHLGKPVNCDPGSRDCWQKSSPQEPAKAVHLISCLTCRTCRKTSPHWGGWTRTSRCCILPRSPHPHPLINNRQSWKTELPERQQFKRDANNMGKCRHISGCVSFWHSAVDSRIKTPKERVINSVTQGGMAPGAKLFLEVLFYQSKSQRMGRATVREAEFLFLDVWVIVSAV